jgi:hypothetical protein
MWSSHSRVFVRSVCGDEEGDEDDGDTDGYDGEKPDP